jgi:protein-tyrosine phosphatase
MASLIRQIASFPFSWRPEYCLDFCYVTPQIIVLSGPTSVFPQRLYRNPINKLVSYLDDKHSAWMIWNFRAEDSGYSEDDVRGRMNHFPWPDHQPPPFGMVPKIIESMRRWLNAQAEEYERGKVAVLHCRAGKGRSGTMTCSYLISECGLELDKALAQFTNTRMRSGFGEGVSIPSQLRWVGYVDQWTRHGKLYVERKIEIYEVRVCGIRDCVEVSIKGYLEAGKVLHTFYTFTNEERNSRNSRIKNETRIERYRARERRAQQNQLGTTHFVDFKPTTCVTVPTSDVNITIKRYIRNLSCWDTTISAAHVWFNAFFEGKGPGNNGQADQSGVFEIEWDRMDGICGFKSKGIRALDRIAIFWKSVQ